jgi:hypothetical protein
VGKSERGLYLTRIFINSMVSEMSKIDGTRHIRPAFPDVLDSIPQFTWED